MGGTLEEGALIFALTFAQGVLGTMSSRSRNRSNMTYHAVCQMVNHGSWVLVLSVLVASTNLTGMIVPYATGYTMGSLLGAKISMRIERWVGATA